MDNTSMSSYGDGILCEQSFGATLIRNTFSNSTGATGYGVDTYWNSVSYVYMMALDACTVTGSHVGVQSVSGTVGELTIVNSSFVGDNLTGSKRGATSYDYGNIILVGSTMTNFESIF
jgi:hypothetical protein